MFYIDKEFQSQIIINKSKFIATIINVIDIEDCNFKLNTIKKKYNDATHNCYAYLIGDNYEIQKFSDDNEPKGTAGIIILEAIKKFSITNILVVITRYFGGTLLGTNGLINAYKESTINCLNKANLLKKVKYYTMCITTSYDKLNIFFSNQNIKIITQEYINDVLLKIEFKTEYLEKLNEILLINHITEYTDIEIIYKYEKKDS